MKQTGTSEGRLARAIRWVEGFVGQGAVEWQVSRASIVAMLLLPGLVALVGAGSALFGKAAYKWFTGEDGVAETLQVLFYLGAFGLSLAIVRHLSSDGKRVLALLYGIVTVGLFFLIGEELSWGQRIFGWGSPDSLAAINKQEETNLHNIHGIGATFKWIQMLVGAYGALLPLVVFTSAALVRFRDTLSFLVPPFTLVLFFLPMFVWRIYRNLFEAPEGLYFVVAEYNEVVELILSMGFFFFMVFQLRRLRSGRALLSHAPLGTHSTSPPYGV
jgi:hypothetical protein